MEILKFKFDENLIKKLYKEEFMIRNEPIVYMICNKKNAYIGISKGVDQRMKQHLRDKTREELDTLYIIKSNRFNGSVIEEIEKYLIRFISSSKKYKLQNRNKGQKGDHHYSNKEEFYAIFKELWEELMKKKIVTKPLPLIENSTIYKFSPYTYLNDEQYKISQKIIYNINNGKKQFLINGGAGTGKTVLALYLMKYLIDNSEQELKIGFVIPGASLRGTLKEVFKNIEGFKPEMILKPTQVANNKYDILIVDEAHRLKRHKGLSMFDNKDFNNACKILELDKNSSNEVDIIKKCSNVQILFYDKMQRIRKSDIEPEVIQQFSENSENYKLSIQNRIKGGNKYIKFIDKLLHQKLKKTSNEEFDSYEFKVFDSFKDLKNTLEKKEEKYKMCRLIAGYAWNWNKKSEYDFELEGIKLKWNSKTSNWINSKNSANEVGCVHTIQGYDLNYAGVIIGPEVTFDKNTKKIKIIKKNYKDKLGRVLADEEELKDFILDIYFVLLTRGIRGTYVYICDENLKQYLRKFINFEN